VVRNDGGHRADQGAGLRSSEPEEPTDAPSTRAADEAPPPSPTEETDAPAPPGESERKRRPLPWWQELIALLATAFVLALLVKTFFLQAFYIPSASMEPTLMTNDKILVEKVSYWNGDIHRGDIVVFDDPGGWLSDADEAHASNVIQRGLEIVGLYPTGGHLVKRVIGVGGDIVSCRGPNARLRVNGVPLREDYLPDEVRACAAAESMGPNRSFRVVVPEDRLWVMGDNRDNSADSTAHLGSPGGGTVPAEDVVGKVWAIVWPASRAGFIDRPDTFENPALDGS
jgi:signal peptidase I